MKYCECQWNELATAMTVSLLHELRNLLAASFFPSFVGDESILKVHTLSRHGWDVSTSNMTQHFCANYSNRSSRRFGIYSRLQAGRTENSGRRSQKSLQVF